MNYDDDDDGETICELASSPVKEEPKGSTFVSPPEKSEKRRDTDLSADLTASTQNRQHLNNRYALFEQYLSFLHGEKDEQGAVKALNPVLMGYWCNLFRSLVNTHANEVFMYIYEH